MNTGVFREDVNFRGHPIPLGGATPNKSPENCRPTKVKILAICQLLFANCWNPRRSHEPHKAIHVHPTEKCRRQREPLLLHLTASTESGFYVTRPVPAGRGFPDLSRRAVDHSTARFTRQPQKVDLDIGPDST